MRIAYLARPTSGNGFYRGTGPMAALAERGHHVRALPVDDERPQPVGSLDGLDVLHIHRYWEERTWRIARDAKTRGAAVVWDNDDHQAAMPRSGGANSTWTGYRRDRRLAATRRVWEHVHLVTTPSMHLADQLRSDGAPHTQVIPNYLPDAFLATDRRPHAGLTIGWTAGLEHAADVERLPIVPALQRLLDERPDVRVVTLGLRLGLRSERYAHHRMIPLHALTQQLAEFDVAIAPLADMPFNRSRSDVKLKEYAAAGVPWLASPTGPYRDLGEREGGRLVADDRWHEELTRLLDKPKDRRKLVKRGTKWVAAHTLSRNASAWEDAFGTALERARAAA